MQRTVIPGTQILVKCWSALRFQFSCLPVKDSQHVEKGKFIVRFGREEQCELDGRGKQDKRENRGWSENRRQQKTSVEFWWNSEPSETKELLWGEIMMLASNRRVWKLKKPACSQMLSPKKSTNPRGKLPIISLPSYKLEYWESWIDCWC